MKKSIAIVLIACALLLGLAACGGGSDSSVPTSVADSSAPASQSTLPDASTTGSDVDLDAALAALSEAAELGGTISVSEIDLKAGGVDVDSIEHFVGAQSQLAAQNGGIVIIIQAKAGMADAVASDMDSFREYSLGNADYEEFEEARTNTQAGTITVYDSKDIIVYAVSATGDTAAVASAQDGLFA